MKFIFLLFASILVMRCGAPSNNNTGATACLNVKIDTIENSLKNYGNIPKMCPKLTFLPKEELVESNCSEQREWFIFDSKSKFVKKISSVDFQKSNPYLLRCKNQDAKNIIDLKKISENEKISIFEANKNLKISKNILRKAARVEFSPTDIEPKYDIFSRKINCFTICYQIFIFDKNEKIIFRNQVTELYDWVGDLKRKFYGVENGINSVFAKNQELMFSTKYSYSGGYENFADIDFHIFKNLKSGFSCKFKVTSADVQYSHTGQVENICISDSLIQFRYENRPNIFRVIVEPHNRKIYTREYHEEKDFGGNRVFGNLTLPNGKLEDYHTYSMNSF